MITDKISPIDLDNLQAEINNCKTIEDMARKNGLLTFSFVYHKQFSIF